MLTMLIFNTVLLLGLARCASTSEETDITTTRATTTKRDSNEPVGSIVWSRKSNDSPGKRYYIPYSGNSGSSSEALQAGTTVHTIPSHGSSPVSNYGPYQLDAINIPTDHRGFSQRANIPSQPTLQGGFQASIVSSLANLDSQNGYTNNSPSYGPQARKQFQNNALIGGNENIPQYGYPSNYRSIPETRKASGQLRSSPLPVGPGGYQPFAKFRSSPSAVTAYPDHSFENLPKYRFNPGSTAFSAHSPSPVGSSQRANNSPPHQISHQPINNKINAPPSGLSSQLSNKHGHNYNRYGGSTNVDYPVKKSQIPLSLHSSSPSVSEFVKAFESEPVILNTGREYQTQPSSSGPNFHYTKDLSLPLANSPSSFVPINGNYEPRILPIQSSRSTPQIPQYKAASVNGFSTNRRDKSVDRYEPIANQPQFHFTTGNPRQSIDNRQPIVYHSEPFGQIRTDVEYIDKKRTTTPSPYDTDDDNYDQDFKTGGSDFGYSGSYESENSPPSKIKSLNGNYELPRSNLFNSYDEAFGKYAKLASIEQDMTEKRGQPTLDETTKPVYQSIEEEDDDGRDNSDDKSSGEYRSSFTDDKDSNGSYEDESEAESRRSHRQGYHDGKEKRNDDDDDDDDDEDDDDDAKSSYRSYGQDFEKEFEESYRKDPPKSEYVHVKEVPEIEEQSSKSKKHPTNRIATKSSRGGTKTKTRRIVRDDYELPKAYETKTTHQYVNPKNNYYRDNEGHSSRSAPYKWSETKESQLKDSYGYKIPNDRGITRYGKTKDFEITRRKDESTEEISKKREALDPSDEGSSSSSSIIQKPVTLTFSSIDTPRSYTFEPDFASTKLSKKFTKDRNSHGASSQQIATIFDPENSSYRSGQANREGFSYLSNGQVIRDLTGI